VEVVDARAGVWAGGGGGRRRVLGAGGAVAVAEGGLERVVGTRAAQVRRGEVVTGHAEAGSEDAGADRRGIEVGLLACGILMEPRAVFPQETLSAMHVPGASGFSRSTYTYWHHYYITQRTTVALHPLHPTTDQAS
jgi:hypothetical protein